MSKRRKRIETNLFADADSKVNPKELDSSIFGGQGWFDTVIEDETITFLSINKLQADLSQPRRSMPSFLYKAWDGSADQVGALFEKWLQAVNEERGSNLQLRAYFNVADSERTDENARDTINQSLEADFMAVVDLAVSIRRDGLTNAITVARNGETYLIETGERRWLAFHLLNLLFQDEDEARWQNIPARIVEKVNIWRQANENNVRADLNAIDKARQFALLLMDLLQERGEQFKTMHETVQNGGSEYDFYTQVSNGDQHRVPRGRGEQIINAMGLKNIRQLSYYRNLLSLPYEAWLIADDYNLTERALRDCLQMANNDPYYIVALVKDMVKQGDTDKHTTTPKPRTAPRKKSQANDDEIFGYRDFSKNARTVQRYIGKAGKLKNDEKRDALQKINAMRQWLGLAEKQLNEK